VIATGCIVSVAMAHGAESHRVKAVFVAQESSLHTSLNNRDVYLLRVKPQHGAIFEAIAIDNYPGYADALPLHSLADGAHFSVKLERTPYCDQVARDGQAAMRCFTIERGSWKGPKKAADEWWK
jgi:hypothetical protein